MTWLWGGYAVGNPTLQRFFSLHYLLPFVIAGVVVLHIWALHVVGQNNPTGIEPKSDKDTVPFTPYATIKDGFCMALFCIVFAWFVFYIPNYLGHADNYIPANPAVTPTHIVPEWYYLPFYAILRAIPNKLLGVVALFGSIVHPRLPAVARHLAGALGDYRPLYRQFFWIFVAGLPRARLARLEAGRRRLRDRRAHPDRLLLRPLPHHPAAARLDRDAEAAAELDLRGGAEEGADGASGPAPTAASARGRPMIDRVSPSLSPARCSACRRASRRRRSTTRRSRRARSGRSPAPFGNFDRGQLQRGFKVYHEVCQPATA